MFHFLCKNWFDSISQFFTTNSSDWLESFLVSFTTESNSCFCSRIRDPNVTSGGANSSSHSAANLPEAAGSHCIKQTGRHLWKTLSQSQMSTGSPSSSLPSTGTFIRVLRRHLDSQDPLMFPSCLLLHKHLVEVFPHNRKRRFFILKLFRIKNIHVRYLRKPKCMVWGKDLLLLRNECLVWRM